MGSSKGCYKNLSKALWEGGTEKGEVQDKRTDLVSPGLLGRITARKKIKKTIWALS